MKLLGQPQRILFLYFAIRSHLFPHECIWFLDILHDCCAAVIVLLYLYCCHKNVFPVGPFGLFRWFGSVFV